MSTIIRSMEPGELEAMLMAENADRAHYMLTADDLEPLKAYVDAGIEPGGFLMAVLRNDLSDAVGRADLYNRRRLFEYCSWLYNEAPSTCWGSEEKVEAWLAHHGMRGA